MGYQRNTFYDPQTGETYQWHVNHSDESTFGKTRQVSTGAPTGYSGLVMQQGDDEPMVIEVTGTILHETQHRQFIHWFALCATRTIWFGDFAQANYEVVITSYLPQRKRTLRNPRDSSIPLHYYTYTMRMQVIGLVGAPGDNPWAGQVTP